MNPKISIVTVVYNEVDKIAKTIQSVVEQKYHNIEYIIIDGCSIDGTVQVIQQYKPNISYFVSEKDNGIYDAMNKGIDLATGDWIIFLNAGDYFVDASVVNAISKFTSDGEVDLIYGSIYLDHLNGIEVKPKAFTLFNILFWGTGVLCHQTMFVRTRCIVNYSTSYKLKGELNWYFDLTKNLKNFLITDFPIVVYSTIGIGTKNYTLNHFEAFKVVFKQQGILGFIAIPFLCYGFFRSWVQSFKEN